jgi:hypothetical protein
VGIYSLTEIRREPRGEVMMRVSLIAVFMLFIAASAGAQTIEASEMVFCPSIEERAPVQPDSIFHDTVEKVYCYTRITGAVDSMSVFHVWYHDDVEKARVELAVRSADWRTWSSKKLLEGWTGIWRVDVMLPDGKLLRSKEFLVKPATE